MTTPNKLNEFNHAEEPARRLLERLGWTYAPRDALAAERGDEREVLLKGRLRDALLRLNEWLTESQADRVIFELENVNATGMARNQAVHEYLTYGMPLTVDGPRGRDTRTVRFFDFDHPESGLNQFVVTTQFRVRRGPSTSSGRGEQIEDDERLVIPDLVLFVNGIPLVVMEAKSPSLLDVWKSQAVRQLRRYQEAGPEWHGRGAPELFRYNLLCVAHCGASAAYSTLGAPENAYFEWKWLGRYSEDEVRQKFETEPQGQAQLIVGLLSPATLLDILRDYVVYEPERGRLGQEAASLPAVPGGKGGHVPHPRRREAHRAGRRGLAHPGIGEVADHAVAGHQNPPGAGAGQCHHRGGHRPHPTGQADCRDLRTLRLPRSGADGPVTPRVG